MCPTKGISWAMRNTSGQHGHGNTNCSTATTSPLCPQGSQHQFQRPSCRNPWPAECISPCAALLTAVSVSLTSCNAWSLYTVRSNESLTSPSPAPPRLTLQSVSQSPPLFPPSNRSLSNCTQGISSSPRSLHHVRLWALRSHLLTLLQTPFS